MAYKLRPAPNTVNGRSVYLTHYKNIFIIEIPWIDIYKVYNTVDKVRDVLHISKEVLENGEARQEIDNFKKHIDELNIN